MWRKGGNRNHFRNIHPMYCSSELFNMEKRFFQTSIIKILNELLEKE